MADRAHEWTDGQIEELERRFERTYSQAAREMREKLDLYLSQYEEANAHWKDMLRSGEVTDKQYREWLKAQAVRRDYLVDMCDTLAHDATRTNQLAFAMINDELPRVYAENANYAAYGIESHLHANTHAFDLVDQSTVRRMMGLDDEGQIMKEAVLLPEDVSPPLRTLRKVNVNEAKDVRWNRQKFNAAITQSILQGESIPNTAKRLSEVLNMGKNMAVRAARTSITSAENAGRIDSYLRAKRIGIELEQEWLATLDERTRYSHRELDGQHVPVGGKFKVPSSGHELEFPADPKADPSEVWNCFIGETTVCADSQIEKSYCHEYRGELVTIDTATGVHFTCTPNHPILTASGWVPAKSLHDGDNLLITGVRDSKVSRGNPHVDHVFPSMKALHELLCVLSSKRAVGLSVNFHGDVAASNVEVVAKEGLLRLCIDASRIKRVIELALEGTDLLHLGKRHSMERILRVPLSASRIMRRLRVCASLLWGHGFHADIHGLRASTGLDSSVTEYAIDNLPAETMVRSELLSGLSRQVLSDEVVGVKVSYTRGTQVYNLQTGNGYYFANQSDNGNFIIAKNCRCTLVAWFPEDGEESAANRFSRLPEGMTYEQWKNAKQDERNQGIIDDGNPTELAGVRRGRPMTFDEANELRGNPDYNIAEDARRRYYEINRERDNLMRLAAFKPEEYSQEEFQRLTAELEDARRAYDVARREQNGYRINCQTCVVANEARRRGYNVEATPNVSGSANERLSRNTSLAWIDRSTGGHPSYIRYDGSGREDALGRPIPTRRTYTEWLFKEGTIEEGARYTIEFEWSGRGHGGHIVCLERTEDGLRMYDPQCGETYDEAGIRDYLGRVKYRRSSYGHQYAFGPDILKVSDFDFDKDLCDQILREAR